MASRTLKVPRVTFSSGEIDPEFWGRSDLARWGAALKTCRNWIVTPGGAVITRPGFEFLAHTLSDIEAHLLPFVFNDTQTYVLELGGWYLRVWRNGALIMDGAAPLVKTTPWDSVQAGQVRWAQVNDVMILVHPEVPPQELRRLAEDVWELRAFTVVKSVSPPTAIVHANAPFLAGTTERPAEEWAWVVTSVDINGVESIASAPLTALDAVLYSDRVKPKFTWTAPDSGTPPAEYNVYRGRQGIYGYVGTTKTNAFTDPATAPDYADSPPVQKDPFVEQPQASTEPAVVITPVAGIAEKVTLPEAFDDNYEVRYRLQIPEGQSAAVSVEYTLPGPEVWIVHSVQNYQGYAFNYGGPSGVAGARDLHPVINVHADGLGFGAKFRVVLTLWNAALPVPTLTFEQVSWRATAPNTDVASYPSAVCFYEQRLVFGGFSANPSALRGSRTGDLRNFDASEPPREDDAIEFELASVRLDQIRSLVPLRAILILTAGAEWIGRGAQGPLSPTNFEFHPFSYEGTANVEPVVAGHRVLFCAQRARAVHELMFDPQGAEPSGARDLTVLARHLFRNREIRRLAWAKEPHSVLWVVRENGLVGLTYSPEHDVWAWHRHDTDGQIESITVIPEGGRHAVYVVVRREIEGVAVRYVERLADRYHEGPGLILLDSAVVVDGRVPGTTVFVSSAGGWAAGDTVMVTADQPATFAPEHVGQHIHVRVGAAELRAVITTYVTPISIDAKLILAPPTETRVTWAADWAIATNVVTGLDHLEAKTVRAQVDGNSHPERVVAGGTITLDTYAEVIVVGLPYTCDVVPLTLVPQADGAFLRPYVGPVRLEVGDYRGLKVGQDENSLREVQERQVVQGYDTITPQTGVVEVELSGSGRAHPTILVRQDEPLPATLISIVAGVTP